MAETCSREARDQPYSAGHGALLSDSANVACSLTHQSVRYVLNVFDSFDRNGDVFPAEWRKRDMFQLKIAPIAYPQDPWTVRS